MMFRMLYILKFTILIFASLSCKKQNNAKLFTAKYIEPLGNEKYLNTGSDFIFNQKAFHTFEINLSDEALAFIDADPAAEEYVEASLTFNGETISPVGIRYKGSIGAFAGGVSGKNWLKPSGYKTATKLSLKIKINWKDKKRTFYGLKKLQFHSQNHDPTQMRERLSYYLFREMGIIAPRSVHAKVIINGKFYGVYALTEQIDKQFVKENYEDASGNLYKEVWPLKSNGKPNSRNAFKEKLKTNKKKRTNFLIKEFAKEVYGSNSANGKNAVEKYMNIEEIITYAVVDRMIKHDDGPFHWYSYGFKSTNHNYYWYENPTTQKLHLIPWDLDHALENMNYRNPVTGIADKWGEISNNGKPFRYGAFGFKQKSAAADKLTYIWTTYDEEYNRIKEEFKNGPYSESNINTLLDEWTEQIKEATTEASKLHVDALNLSNWEHALQELKHKINHARKYY